MATLRVSMYCTLHPAFFFGHSADMPSSQKFKILIEGLPRRKQMVLPRPRGLGGHHERTRRVLGVKRGVVRAGHTRPGQIWSWGKLSCIDGMYCTVLYDLMIRANCISDFPTGASGLGEIAVPLLRPCEAYPPCFRVRLGVASKISVSAQGKLCSDSYSNLSPHQSSIGLHLRFHLSSPQAGGVEKYPLDPLI